MAVIGTCVQFPDPTRTLSSSTGLGSFASKRVPAFSAALASMNLQREKHLGLSQGNADPTHC
jgi:hypothetical protein